MPHAQSHTDLDNSSRRAPAGGLLGPLRRSWSALLKAWWGDAATADNDFRFGYLPRISGDHSIYPTMMRMLEGGCRASSRVGQNPVVGSANAGLQRRRCAT